MIKEGLRLPLLLFLFLLLLICLSYSITRFSPFVLDDYSAFLNYPNLFIKDLSFDSLAGLLDTRFGAKRVIPIATFALDHYLGQGQSMVNYHLTNIVIHLLATVALAFFLSALLKTGTAGRKLRFFRQPYFILAICSLWALSPLQTNAVTYLVQRMTSLAALFYLAACGFYIHARHAKTGWQKFFLYTACVTTAVAAFFSKENSATLPLAILMIEFIFISPGLGVRLLKTSKPHHWLIAILILALLLPLLENFWNSAIAGYSGRHFSMSERLYTQLRIVVFYISLLILPLPGRLNLDHDVGLSTSLLSPLTTFWSLLLLSGLLLTAVMQRRRHPLFSFGILWFFVNLLIESTVIPLELIFEHRLYLPSVGFFIGAVSVSDLFFAGFAAHSRPEFRKTVFFGFIVLVAVSSILTTLRNDTWRDKVTLSRDCYEKSPNKSRAAGNLAMALGRAGLYDECVRYGIIAVSLGEQGYEEYVNSANNTVSCLMFQQKYSEAVEKGEFFRDQIVQKDLEFLEGAGLGSYMFNLGRAYTETKQYDKALKSFLASLFRGGGDRQTFQSINRLFILARDDEQARKQFAIGGESYDIPIYLASIAIQYRLYGLAPFFLQEAERMGADQETLVPLQERIAELIEQNSQKKEESLLAHNHTYATNHLFRFYLQAVDFILKYYRPLSGAPASWLIERAGRIDPQNSFMPVYHAKWYMKHSEYGKAIETLERYMDVDGDFVPVLKLAGICYKKNGDYEKSVAVFKKILDIYPGTDKWQYYLSFIYMFEDKINGSGRTVLDYY